MRELHRQRRSLRHARALPSRQWAISRYARANDRFRRYGTPPCKIVVNAALSRLPPDTTAHTREYS